MSTAPDQASKPITGLVISAITFLLVWGLLTGWFGQWIGDTSRARERIEQVFHATGVHCRRLGDLVEVKQWACEGRYLGTDGVHFWGNLYPDGTLNVGLGNP